MDKTTERTVLKVALGFIAVLILGIGSLLAMAEVDSGNTAANENEEDEGLGGRV